MSPRDSAPPMDFIRQIVAEDLRTGRCERVHTRFPPEPNAYGHLGHAGAALLNYGIAQDFGGLFTLRFDDTNPLTEEQEYVEAFIEDLRWLGLDWGERLTFASDYFEAMYAYAEELVRKGLAYVDDQSAEDIRRTRGTLTQPGTDSPHRARSPEENVDLLRRMRAGEFPDGSRVLRARIDMAHPNLNLRDPVMYRILHAAHYRRGEAWCLYPTYDWAHGIEDSLEGITHSCCSIEFENHRPLYDWFLRAINQGRQPPIPHPQQIEFARFNVTYTLTSKRKLLKLIREGHLAGWDDPRMPTIRGLRRRGVPPEAIHEFFRRIGVSKTPATAQVELLEHCIRQDLNPRVPRVMAVLRPLKLVLENYPEGQSEELDAVNNPEDPAAGTRKVPFSRELYIERDDFLEAPPRKFYRLAPGREVRLRYAYFITCTDVVKDAEGTVVELRGTYDPATRGGDAPDGRKVKATLHWVSAPHALDAEVRLTDHLFTREDPEDVPEGQDFTANLNPESLETVEAKVEPSLAQAEPGARVQFERLGYFCVDADTAPGRPVFNRTVTLRDTWARIQKQQKKQA